jgi:hypothetical protein
MAALLKLRCSRPTQSLAQSVLSSVCPNVWLLGLSFRLCKNCNVVPHLVSDSHTVPTWTIVAASNVGS